jgi:peptide/nickel transport system permease protein
MNIIVKISIGLISLYILTALGMLFFGSYLMYEDPITTSYVTPRLDLGIWGLWGTDALGRSMIKKLLLGVKASVIFGLTVAIGSVLIGTILGIVSGFFGGWIDLIITWLFTTLSAVPGILMLLAIMFLFGNHFWTAVIALVSVDWIGLCRMMRAEVVREKTKEYVAAATAIGCRASRKLTLHIYPNVSHYTWIYFALHFIFAVKAEIILAFLGFQFSQGVSWGVIIDEARGELLQGIWWPILGATLGMAGLLLSLQVCSDWLRDRFDPKLKDEGVIA